MTTMMVRIRRLLEDKRGVSAVEFALVLPVMVTLYLGVTEVSQGIGADRKLTLTARAVGDLVSQVGTIDNAGITNSLNAAIAVMAPYPSSKLKVTVSSININLQGQATVLWSDTLNGTKRGVGSGITLPAALAVPDSTLIFSEVEYIYMPAVGHVITGPITLKDKIYMRPRLTKSVTRT